MQDVSMWLYKGMRLFTFLCTVAIALATAAPAHCGFAEFDLLSSDEEDEAIIQAPMGPAGFSRGTGSASSSTTVRNSAGVLHDNATAPKGRQPLDARVIGDLINSDPFRRPPQDAARLGDLINSDPFRRLPQFPGSPTLSAPQDGQ